MKVKGTNTAGGDPCFKQTPPQPVVSLCRSRSFLFHFFGARIPSGPMVKSKKQVKMIGRVAENHERQGSRSGSWVLISNENNADTLRRRPWVCTIIGINFILCFK